MTYFGKRNVPSSLLVLLCLVPASSPSLAQDAPPGPAPGTLQHQSALQRRDLRNVISITVSPDGKHAYSAAYNAMAVAVFQRDAKTGRLRHRQTISGKEDLNGAACLRLSPKGRYAVATAFRSRTVILFERDQTAGTLKVLDVARDGAQGVKGLNWVIDAVFSPDGRFVYAIAPRSAAVTAFRLSSEGKLQFVEANFGTGDCFAQVRGIAIHPDGKSIYTASSDAGTLVVLDRDARSGKTKIRQIIKDETGGVHGLAGAFSVTCSPDGKFVYTSAGRFKGDSAVSVFKPSADGRLALVQEIFGGQDALKGFEGGNEIAVSSDGLSVYAVGSRSNSVACLRRDPRTGRLSHLQTLTHGAEGVGPLTAPAGVAVSPDGRNVYVAVEFDHALSVFRRSTVSAGDRQRLLPR